MVPTPFENPKAYKGSPKWQIKIYDGESANEDPHVNVIFKGKGHGRKTWRIDLKTLEVMDRNPPKRELPKEFFDEIRENLYKIRTAWNDTYPKNPVEITGDEEDAPKQSGSETLGDRQGNNEE